MDVVQLVGEARDLLAAKRVYGEPYEKNGTTVIPAASVRGGGGGGGDKEGQGGGGFGMNARPVGAWVVRDGEATWKPAPDLNRLNLGWMVVALAAILTWGSVARARAHRPMVSPALAKRLRACR